MRIGRAIAWASVLVLSGWSASGRRTGEEPSPRWREPVAMALSHDGDWLYVANRASGTVSAIDAGRGRVAAERDVGGELADLAATPDGRSLLAVDERGNRLLLLEARGPEVEVRGAVEVAGSPVGVAIAEDGRRAYVASLWTRRLTVVELDPEAAEGARLRVAGEVALPFEPRRLLAVGRDRLIAADAFGGGLAVVDAASRTLESSRELPAHNIRGLALGDDGRLLIAHQVLNPSARTDPNDIHWGSLITNNLRSLPLVAVLDPEADPLREGMLYQLGDVGDGGGDPNGVAVLPDGRVAVALGGVDKVALLSRGGEVVRRVGVGRRPVALASGRDGRLFVANAFADSISLVAAGEDAAPVEVALGTRPEPDPVRRGRMLFYDAGLSLEGWMSCHSCHTDGHTSGLLADTLGDGTYGTPKRTPSLLGVGATAPWAWDGSVAELAGQVDKSIRTTMRGSPAGDDRARDLESYLRSLAPAPGGPASDRSDEAQVARGEAAFRRLRCDRCHAPPSYTTARAYDVGLADEAGLARFNPPSLLGVGRRKALFHDGRARSLRDVFARFGHQLDGPLAAEELGDLLTFLRRL